MNASNEPRSVIIARQNDQFRTSFGTSEEVPGRIVQTRAVADLGQAAGKVTANKVMTFDAFTEDCDPYGEHEMGSFVIHVDDEPIIIWWKIDLFALDYEHGSDDPTNTDVTRRVMTILLPSDY